MHNKAKIYAAAILAVVVALAVIPATASDTEGAEIGDVDTIQYKVGDAIYETDLNGDNFIVGYDGAEALYWTGADGRTYYNGQTVSVGDIDAAYLNGTAFRLTAVQAVEGTEYASLVIQGVTYTIPLADGALDTTSTAYADAKAAYDALDAAGYKLTWSSGDPLSDSGIADGTVYTLTTGIGTVVWVVDGVVIGSSIVGDDGTVAVQDAPSKDFHTFAGWAYADGTIAIEYVASTGEYTGDGISGSAADGYSVEVADTGSDSGTVTYYASWVPYIYTVTFMAGEDVVSTVSVYYGETVVMPALPEGYSGWDYDFATIITGDVTILAIEAEVSDVYTVTFVVDGVTIATYTSDSVTLPSDPTKEGYEFVGWYIGSELIEDPVGYAFVADTAFVAGFKAVSVVEYTVTLQYADGTVDTIAVAEGESVELPAAGEGMVWAYAGAVYAGGAISGDIVLSEVVEYYTVTYKIGALTLTSEQVRYGETAPEVEYSYAGYDGWDFDFATAIYADTTIYAAEIVEEESSIFDSPVKVLALIFAILAIIGIVAYILYLRKEGRLPAKLSFLAKKEETVEEVEIFETTAASTPARATTSATSATKIETEETATTVKKE